MASPAPAPVPWRPWRSAALGWLVAAAVLVVAVPLFLCMPPWPDLTLYEVAARTIRRGGVHYRDVFDTNPPGFPLILAALHSVFGPALEVVRAFDLLVAAGCVVVLARFARAAGGTRAAAAWLAAGVALFYPFTTEFNHCQRDLWVLLPAALAAWVRARRLARLADTSPGEAAGRFGWLLPAVGEGCLWGVAAWIKPHAVVPAAAVWVIAALLAPTRAVLRDLAGVLLGVAILGAAGVAWLVRTGAWPYFLDVFTNWNPDYAGAAVAGAAGRVVRTFDHFPPWSLAHVIATPVALAGLAEAVRSAFGRTPPGGAGPFYATARTPRELVARSVLAALYLGWLVQAVVLQHSYPYVHVPETILALAVLAGQGWAAALVVMLWLATTGAVLAAVPVARENADLFSRSAPPFTVYRHPLTRPDTYANWRRCLTEGPSPQLRDDLGWYDATYWGVRWADLARVEAFLRTVEPPLRDRGLTCWNDSTHPLYLALGLEPSTRYTHFFTVLKFKAHREDVLREVAACPHRYVVSDLMGAVTERPAANDPNGLTVVREDVDAPATDGRTDALPFWFPRSLLDQFPWDQPVVFRAGRYVVHRVERPVDPGRVARPTQSVADDPGPGLNTWDGDAPDKWQPGGAGALFVIEDEARFAELCGRVKFGPDRPRVDFTRFLVVGQKVQGQITGLRAEPDGRNLLVETGPGTGRADRPRVYLLAYPRAGIERVNGLSLSLLRRPAAPTP